VTLTDPPYICGYLDRLGRTIANDTCSDWLEPPFREVYGLMKPDTLCISFYGWTATEAFVAAWAAAGFRRVGHLVFCKPYASRSGLFRASHECAYVLAKGKPPLPARPVSDVSGWVTPATGCIRHRSRLRFWNPWCARIVPRADWCLTPFAVQGPLWSPPGPAGGAFLVSNSTRATLPPHRGVSANCRDDLLSAFHVKGVKVVFQAHRQVHPFMKDAHNPKVAVVQFPKEHVVVLIAAEIRLAFDVGRNCQLLRETTPDNTVFAKALQMDVKATNVGVRLRLTPGVQSVMPDFVLRGIRARIEAITGHR
jgi:hypothetical protein